MSENPRFYGTDSTDDLETISEVTVEDDGTYSVEVVVVEKDDVQ